MSAPLERTEAPAGDPPACVPLAPLQRLALVHRSPADDPGSQRSDPGAGPALVQVYEYRRQPSR